MAIKILRGKELLDSVGGGMSISPGDIQVQSPIANMYSVLMIFAPYSVYLRRHVFP